VAAFRLAEKGDQIHGSAYIALMFRRVWTCRADRSRRNAVESPSPFSWGWNPQQGRWIRERPARTPM